MCFRYFSKEHTGDFCHSTLTCFNCGVHHAFNKNCLYFLYYQKNCFRTLCFCIFKRQARGDIKFEGITLTLSLYLNRSSVNLKKTPFSTQSLILLSRLLIAIIHLSFKPMGLIYRTQAQPHVLRENLLSLFNIRKRTNHLPLKIL